MKKQFSAAFGFGLAVLLLASLPFIFSDLDLAISAAAFRQNGWPLGDAWLWTALYRWGTLPGLLLGVWGLGAFLGSFIKPAWERWRQPAAVILVALLLGPGLLVNVLGKGYWGRPRPRDVVSLGGNERFQRLQETGAPGRGKSFPSGHPSVGYLFCVLFFLDPKPRRRWVWLGTGVAYGTLMGAARVLQGAHFASDVLWSGGLTYLSSAWAARAVPAWFPGRTPARAPASALKKSLVTGLGLLLLAALALFFLLATPFYKTWEGLAPGTAPEKIVLDLPRGLSEIHLNHGASGLPLQARVEVQGFGFPKLKLQAGWEIQPQGGLWQARLRMDLRGWVTEKKSVVTVLVPAGAEVVLQPEPDPGTRVWQDEKPAPAIAPGP